MKGSTACNFLVQKHMIRNDPVHDLIVVVPNFIVGFTTLLYMNNNIYLNSTTPLSKLLIYLDPENPQQFFGSVTQESSRVKFIYKDFRDPITIGVISLVVVAVAGALCAMSEIVGLYGNKECKKIRVDYGFGWKDGSLQVGCKVECVGTR